MSAQTHTRKLPHSLGIGYLVAGAIFLFDPFSGVFDFLPDAIGYALIAKALYYLADLDDRLSEARRSARRLALLGLGRLLALVLTFAFVSPTERPVFMLLAVFALGVLDILVLLPMWRHFGNGFVYIGSRTNATGILSSRGSRSACDRYVGFSMIYFLLREVLVVLPECTVLTDEQGGVEQVGVSLYDFVGMFRFVGCVISFALGVVWLIWTIRFVHKIRSDKPFIDALRDRYNTEVAPRSDLFAMRSVKASMTALIVAVVLSADLYVEGFSILPDPFSAVAMILSVLYLRRYTQGKYRLPLAASLVYGIFATVGWLMQLFYLSFNDLTDEKILAARLDTVQTLQTVTSVLFVVAFVLILRLLYRLARQYTGLHALRDGSLMAKERTDAIHKFIRRKLIWVGVFAVISAISSLVLWTVAPVMAPVDLLTRPERGDLFLIMLYDFLREAYWMIDLFLGIIFVIVTVRASNEISEQMDYSYLMN